MYHCSCEKSYPDVEYLKTFYPVSIFPIYEVVSDYADRLEYEGSSMFDELPDRELFFQLVNEIYAALPEEITRMNSPENPSYLKELIIVLLGNEFLHRRIRKKEF